jgi:Domain of unknown function (DUF1833)
MTDYAEFFLNTSADIVMLETISLSHTNLSKTYRLVKNKTDGLVAKLENGSTVTFDYMPMSISRGGIAQNIDQSISVTFGDLGEILPQELDLIAEADNFDVKPILTYRTYRSDDLEAPIEKLELKVEGISFNSEGALIEAKTKSMNINGTGELYRIDRFPMLRGLL